jgi:hypothetical protein
MGAPSSGLIAEIFLQYIEHSHLTRLTQTQSINYCRYVDNILIIFDPNHTNLQEILKDFNSFHHKQQFTAETESDLTFNYLDISIRRTPHTHENNHIQKTHIHGRNYPLHLQPSHTHHKYATVRYLYNILDTYKLQQEEYIQEQNITHNTLHIDSFPIRSHKPPTQNPAPQITPHTRQKWASFTYTGKETTYITNIFKRTGIKISFRTAHNLGNLLAHKDHPPPNKFSVSGVYKLTCPDYHKTYVGQTGRCFHTRYKEHMTAFHKNSNSLVLQSTYLKKDTHLAP